MKAHIHKPKSGIGLVLKDPSGELHVCQSPDELWQTMILLMAEEPEEAEEPAAPRRRRKVEDEDESTDLDVDPDLLSGIASNIVSELFRKAQGVSFRGKKGSG